MQKTHVVMLLDESSSMVRHRQAVVDTFNQYTKDVGKNSKRVWMSLFKFAGNGLGLVRTLRLTKIFENRKLKETYPLTTPQYSPNGWTPLYDAIGEVIRRTKKRLPKDAKVLFVIHTDGQENTSTKYNMESIKQLIQKMERKRGWTFVYLGEGAEAWNAGYDFGIDNVANFSSNLRGQAMDSLATSTAFYASTGVSGQSMHGLYAAAGVDADAIDDDDSPTVSSTIVSSDAATEAEASGE